MPKPTSIEDYEVAENEAKEIKLGIWSDNTEAAKKSIRKIDYQDQEESKFDSLGFLKKWKGKKLKVLIEDVSIQTFCLAYIAELNLVIKITYAYV